MKILYVAPRYHTNQIPIMEGWRKRQDEVLFVAQKTNDSENHEVLKPEILGYSKLFESFFDIYKKIRKCNLPDDQYAIATKIGFPPYFLIKKQIEDFMPDIAILRERSVYTMVAYYICKKAGIPAVLYNQSPYFDMHYKKRGIVRWIVKKLTPEIRMTPIMGKRNGDEKPQEQVFYVPFVMYPRLAPEHKTSFLDGKVHIICVAGYHARKQIPMLLQAVVELKKCHFAMKLTVVGEVITEDQEMYYQQMQKLVQEKDLQNCVSLQKNLSRKQIFAMYQQMDLFVLPSTRERASISQLEAMSCSLPIICSDTNGSAEQVRKGVNGYLFKDMDVHDLTEKLKMAVSDPKKLLKMGAASYDMVVREHNFELYYKAICDIKAVGARK